MHFLFWQNIAERSVRYVFSLVSPRSNEEDARRREFILNILLLSCIILSSVATGSLVISFTTLEAGKSTSPILLLGVTSIFYFLLSLSRHGKFTLSSYLLIIFLILPVTYTLI